MLSFKIFATLMSNGSALKSSPKITASLKLFYSTSTKYQYILEEKVGSKQNIGLVTLNRPKALNALCVGMILEIRQAVTGFDNDESIGAIVITGSEKTFAAGADIKELLNHSYSSIVKQNLVEQWHSVFKCKKPIIAAVNGYALGGGIELAIMSDIIFAGEKAKFGVLEITIGSIMGAGGNQRIAYSCGKSFAMEMCLTGNLFTAQEALQRGLVSKVFPPEKVVEEAIKLGERISEHSPIIVQLCKEAVNNAFETSLSQGLALERKLFYSTFATEDRKEGMKAFVEKRQSNFSNK